MMNRTILLLPVLCLFAALQSCKKSHDSSTPSPAPTVGNYLKLTPGNYWIYESYYIDSNGNGSPGAGQGGAPYYDSMYVAADTTFGGHTWHVLMRPEPGTSLYSHSYLRDSLNYEVNDAGRIVLAPDDYSNSLLTLTRGQSPAYPDSATIITGRMADKDKIVATPAGSFTTISFANTYTFYPFAGQPASRPRQTYTRYSAGVGIVAQVASFYYVDPMYVEDRLLRYHVQ